jgi:UDP-N-acetylmuramate--alanine ligase
MGIGGAGMCPLAEAVARKGGKVTGCDLAPGVGLRPLEEFGIPIFEGHDPGHLDDVVALVVTSAVPMEHPEIAAAHARGIPVLKRARALGDWVNAGEVVAISGSHGKTTTTAMTTEILSKGGLRPTGFVGGWVRMWNGNLHLEGDDLFVVEADEYDRSFHQLAPTVAVVTNLEADHLDIYGDLGGVRDAFRIFLDQVREGGTILFCGDDPGAASLAAGHFSSSRSFGFAAGNQLRGVEVDTSGTPLRFRVVEDGVDCGRIELGVPGLHNARNALAAASAARAFGVEWEVIRTALATFSGVARRFQRMGEVGGISVVDDYAHHQTELAAALSTARQSYPASRLVAVFQPHLYSRTRDFAGDFAQILATADEVWIAEIYPAREAPISGVDGRWLAGEVEKAVAARGKKVPVHFHPDLETLAGALARDLRPGDLCLTLGAGSIEIVAPEVVRILAEGNSSGSNPDRGARA